MPVGALPVGSVWLPCRCGGKEMDECGLSFCRESRLERLARMNEIDADDLRALLAAEVEQRQWVHTEGATGGA